MVLYVPPLSLPLFFFFVCLADAKHGLASKEFGWALIVSDAKGSSYKGGKKEVISFPKYRIAVFLRRSNSHFMTQRSLSFASQA